jgi:hypothetical protein
MGKPNLPCRLEAMVPSKDVARGLLCHDGPKPSVLLDAGDYRSYVAITRITRVGDERADLYIFNKC